ncbi:hypothetical protein BG004_005305, partial [Podila humilis]
ASIVTLNACTLFHFLRPTSKRQRTLIVMDTNAEDGLTEKAVLNGVPNLSLLDNGEKILLLDVLGQVARENDTCRALSRTAIKLHGTNMEDLDKLSAHHGTLLPVVETKELFIRKAYKELHDTILGTVENARVGNAKAYRCYG